MNFLAWNEITGNQVEITDAASIEDARDYLLENYPKDDYWKLYPSNNSFSYAIVDRNYPDSIYLDPFKISLDVL